GEGLVFPNLHRSPKPSPVDNTTLNYKRGKFTPEKTFIFHLCVQDEEKWVRVKVWFFQTFTVHLNLHRGRR
ncbi:hypothetical protein, partial [Thermus albus]|uniref:hypothetical protein n=1 Tax=Thermus albus TaxID=2908146 RepID=UPI001FAAE097